MLVWSFLSLSRNRKRLREEDETVRVSVSGKSVLLLLSLLSALPCIADDADDVYANLQALGQDFPYRIQADPMIAGKISADRKAGNEPYMIYKPVSNVAGAENQPLLAVNGLNATLRFASASAETANYSSSIEITKIVGEGDRVIFSKDNAWDHWPVKGYVPSGNTVYTEYDVKDAVLVRGTASGYWTAVTPRLKCRPVAFEVKLTRDPTVIGLGAFTIPILPVAIMYCPPPGRQTKNFITYSSAECVGTTLTTSITQEESSTSSGTAARYSELGMLNSALGVLKAGGAAYGLISGNPAAGALVGKIADGISSMMGSAKATDTTGTSRVEDHALTLIDATQMQRHTLGTPGVDDKIVFLRGLRMAWLANGTEAPQLVLLGAMGSDAVSAQDLRDDLNVLKGSEQPRPRPRPRPDPNTNPNPPDDVLGAAPVRIASSDIAQLRVPARNRPLRPSPLLSDPLGPKTRLDIESARALLALYPFAQSAGADLKEPRYARARFHEAGTACQYLHATQDIDYMPVRHQIVTADLAGSANFATHIEEYTRGMLYFFGIGVTESGKTMSSSRYCSAKQSVVNKTTQTDLHLDIDEQADEEFWLEAFYDCAFGTFVFREVPESQALGYSGTMTESATGEPAANQWVTLTVGGATFLTQTDSKGRYSFNCSAMKPGKGTIKFRDRESAVQIGASRSLPAPNIRSLPQNKGKIIR